MSELQPGLTIRFDYPAHNFRGVRKRMERRRLTIERVRDTEEFPVPDRFLKEEPLLARGKLLIYGMDLDKQERRSFYADSMENLEQIAEPAFAGEPESPERFAVVEADTQRVVARGLTFHGAMGFAKTWASFHGLTLTVAEPLKWPSDDQVLEQLQLAHEPLSPCK